MNMLLLTDIIVPNLVEVNEAHIVSSNLRHHFLILKNLAREVVLGFAANVTEFKARSDPVLRIFEAHLTNQLVTHRAHKNVVK